MSTATKIILLVLTILIGLTGVGLLFWTSIGEATEYYKKVDEVVAKPDKWLKKNVMHVHGYARNVPTEGRMEGQKIWREFDLENKGRTIRVRHEGVVPDTFKEQAETVVKGHLARENGELVFTTVGGEGGIMAKCPSKYDGARAPAPALGNK